MAKSTEIESRHDRWLRPGFQFQDIVSGNLSSGLETFCAPTKCLVHVLHEMLEG